MSVNTLNLTGFTGAQQVQNRLDFVIEKLDRRGRSLIRRSKGLRAKDAEKPSTSKVPDVNLQDLSDEELDKLEAEALANP